MDGFSHHTPEAGRLSFGIYAESDSVASNRVGNWPSYHSNVSSIESIYNPAHQDTPPKGWNHSDASSEMRSDMAVVPDDHEPHNVNLPDLLCEECEKNLATVHCEACEETLCEKCSDLLHLQHCNGEPHEHVANRKLRPVRRGDNGAVAKPEKDPNLIPDWEVDEKEHVALGRDLSKPTAVEAPRINTVSMEGQMAAIPKYEEGQRVLFSCDEVDFEDDSQQAAETGWRGKEAYGIIMGGPVPRHGQYGSVYRRSDDNENYYRVRVVGFASEDYSEIVVYKKAQERAVFEGVTIKGKVGDAPMAKERKRGVAIDRKLREVKDSKKTERYQLGKNKTAMEEPLPGAQGSGRWTLPQDKGEGEYRVLLLGESLLKDPWEVYQGLEARRKRALVSILQGYGWRCSLLSMAHALETWYYHVDYLHFVDFSEAAVIVQTYIRRFLAQAKLRHLQNLVLVQQHERWLEFHAPYNYVWDPHKQRDAYTIDGIHFFATRAENNVWCKMWMKKVAKMWELHVRADSQSMVNAWRRWVEQIPEYDMDSEEEEEEEEEDEDLEVDTLDRIHGFGQKGNIRESLTDLSSLSTALSRRPAPWHPALGMDLPELPKMWAKRGIDGNLNIEVPTKFNSFRANMAGPTDTSNWVAPGLILMGAYPEGQARKVGKKLIHSYPESVNQILLSDVGTFVCLMEHSELREIEEELGITQPLSESLDNTYETCRSYLQQSLKSAKTELFKAQQEVKHAPRFQPHDLRYPEAMVKLRKLRASERLCLQSLDRIKRALVRYPFNPRYVHYPIPDNGTVPVADLHSFLLYLEHLVREDGECLYIFSRLGHGRAGLVAGCLLGRLYGLTHEDVLERLQVCHDSRTLLVHEPLKISCPQTLPQVAMTREILRGTDVLYSDLKKVTGFPNADERRELIRRKERGFGVPQETKTVEILHVLPPNNDAIEADSSPQWEQDFGGVEIPPEVEEEDEKMDGEHHHNHDNNNHRHCSACHQVGFRHVDSSSEEEEIESEVEGNEEELGDHLMQGEEPRFLLSISEPSLRTLRATTSLTEYQKSIAKKLPSMKKNIFYAQTVKRSKK